MSTAWDKFDEFPEHTVYCRCGTIYRSHSKIEMLPSPRIVARKPCPSCGRADNLSRASSDPETMTIKTEFERDEPPTKK